MTPTEEPRRTEGKAFLSKTTERMRLTRGVQRLMAPYMGMFMPCKAMRERVEWRAKLRLHGRNSTPSFNE